MGENDDTRRTPDKELIQSVWQEARDLIKRLEGSSVQRLVVAAGEYKIEIERGAEVRVVETTGPQTAQARPGPEEVVADHRHPILAPLVGTFYRASQPGAKPFVEEGDVVDAGQTVAIVEAMKLMNQVAADRGGTVAAIVVDDGEWVEFEQVLMYIEPAEEE